MKNHCKLCLKEEILRKSHVVPEFLHRPVYDDYHRLTSFEPKKLRSTYRQSGLWDRLFCDGCEGRLSQLESYFANVWFKKPVRPDSLEGEMAVIINLDYVKFKLFHLSILWRAHVSDLNEFRELTLGQQAENIRVRILTGDPGPSDVYPISGMALRRTDGSFKDDLMLLPGYSKIENYHLYIMLFGGVFWLCGHSDHCGDCPPVPTNLKNDGTLTLFIQDWMKNSSIQDLFRQMQKH